MYGAQTICKILPRDVMFENDVEMYGAQTKTLQPLFPILFENDVEMYGAQTLTNAGLTVASLRMM